MIVIHYLKILSIIMADSKSLFAVIILVLCLSAVVNSNPENRPPKNICKTCCGNNGGYRDVPECAAVECACPASPPNCATCCRAASTDERCGRLLCDCRPRRAVADGPPVGICGKCCTSAGSTDPDCVNIRCNCPNQPSS